MTMRSWEKCFMASWPCVSSWSSPVQSSRLGKWSFCVQITVEISKQARARHINYNKESKLIEISEKKVKSPRKWHHFVKSVWILFSARKTYNFWSKMKKNVCHDQAIYSILTILGKITNFCQKLNFLDENDVKNSDLFLEKKSRNSEAKSIYCEKKMPQIKNYNGPNAQKMRQIKV